MEPILNFVRLQDGDRLVENAWLQVQEQGHRDRLQIANSIRRGHGRTCEHPSAPRLFSQFLCKYWREVL